MQKNMKKLVGKFVRYHKPNYAWQFGKVKEVVMYKRGPKKGQLKYARIATIHWTGKMVEKDGIMVPQTRWTGPARRTTKITEVLKGKNTMVPMEKWLA
tara:strand:- start:791 stop:1084 length:294 start_codon:yes stop_codon:yes gene_type:complete